MGTSSYAGLPRYHTPGKSGVADSLRVIRCEEEDVYLLSDGRLTHYTRWEKHLGRSSPTTTNQRKWGMTSRAKRSTPSRS